ncbi:hypothetical protein [Streptomyces sp. Amel2xB2]|uniref:nucleotide-binding domain-containing protein n=1 Tax=Streptomyces sp. Amel2xB2 TaxID=1305829 RepID=UPI0015EB37F3|nr:hypothetical protein [Streptomyces sp. Amel2xB2]
MRHSPDCTGASPDVRAARRTVSAERRNEIRGQIIESSRPNARNERTSFRGEHLVECYVVKDGIVVARDRIDVRPSAARAGHSCCAHRAGTRCFHIEPEAGHFPYCWATAVKAALGSHSMSG